MHFTLLEGLAPLLLSASAFGAIGSSTNVRITEYMYDGDDGEFIEIANLGGAPVDLAGWSFDDDNATPGTFDLSAIGVLAPGELAIITAVDGEAFRAAWNLPKSLKIVGDLGKPNGNTLGRNDAINLYDAQGDLIDTLTYGDQAFPGSIRTQRFSGWTIDGIGTDDPYAWQLAVIGDAQMSFVSASGDVGSPGTLILRDPKKPGIPGDLNGDGVVDGADLGILLNNWGDCPLKGDCPADLNGDGVVDGADLGILLNHWS